MKLKVYSDAPLIDEGWVWYREKRGDWVLTDYTEYGLHVQDIMNIRGESLIKKRARLTEAIEQAVKSGIDKVELHGLCALPFDEDLHCELRLEELRRYFFTLAY